MTDRTYVKILEELDWPPIYLVSPEQFEHVDGTKLEGDFGIAAVNQPVITIRKGLRGRVKCNVIYHEIAHHLFPSKHHWWVELFAEKMAKGGGRGYWSHKYGHTIDELPPRSVLLKLARKASGRMKKTLSEL